jgi:hypothetical protein
MQAHGIAQTSDFGITEPRIEHMCVPKPHLFTEYAIIYAPQARVRIKWPINSHDEYDDTLLQN